MSRLGVLISLLAASGLAGCMVGPDFQRPGLDAKAGYTAGPNASATKAGAQTLAYGSDVPGRWWELFRNKQLDSLMQQAIEKNPDLASARAALKQVDELALAQQGGLWPSLSVSGSGERTDTSGSSISKSGAGIYNIYSVQPSASYSLDLFGGTRRSIEAKQAAAEAQGFTAEATYLTITSSLAKAVIQEASLRAQIQALQEVIASYKQLLGVLSNQVNVGTTSRSNLLQQQAALAQAQANLPSLQKSLAQQQNAIAALVGDFPSEYAGRPFLLSSLTLPHKLPVSLPSALVEQRPDIRSAEASLHQATANVGVAKAAMLPSITLSASLPSTAEEIGKLYSGGTAGWLFAASITQPIFEGGKLLHTKRAADAATEQAIANYRSVVLASFRDVADALKAIKHDNEALVAYVAAEKAAADSLSLAKSLFQAGASPYTDVLVAQTTYQNAHMNRASAEATRYVDAVSLFQALGGGWWNRPDNLAALANTDPNQTMPNVSRETK